MYSIILEFEIPLIFAHISLFNTKEEQLNKPADQKTFNVELAIVVLALSLPFSTTLILTILSAGTYFADIWKIGIMGLGFTALGIVPIAASKFYLKQFRKVA